MAKTPKYDLEAVRLAAKNHDINIRGRKVQHDIDNLGYSLCDVAQCIASLNLSDFRKTRYYDTGAYDDVYLCSSPPTEIDEAYPVEIYIKFALIDGEIDLEIDLGSFHT